SALTSTGPIPLAALTFAVATAVLLVPAIHEGGTVATLMRGWPIFLYLGVVPTGLAYVLYTTGLRRTPATMASIAGLLEPLTATILGIIVFREGFGVAGAMGALLL